MKLVGVGEKQILLFSVLLFIQTVKSGDDFFGDYFPDEEDSVDKEIRFTNQLYSGYRNWEERCKDIGGEEVLKAWQKEQEHLLHCFMSEFDLDVIKAEVEEKKKVGELDEVFKNYCSEHVVKVRECLHKFLVVSHKCLHPQDRPGLNVTLQMVDAAINFTCHNAGDRIALFMAEEGVDCVAKHKDEILSCINSSVPEVFQTSNSNSGRMHFYIFQQENCRKGDAMIQCVEDSLMHCADPTPSNLVHALLRAMRDQTPCAASAQSWRSVSPFMTWSPTLTVLLFCLLHLANRPNSASLLI